jgi:hypothetical protein
MIPQRAGKNRTQVSPGGLPEAKNTPHAGRFYLRHPALQLFHPVFSRPRYFPPAHALSLLPDKGLFPAGKQKNRHGAQ